MAARTDRNRYADYLDVVAPLPLLAGLQRRRAFLAMHKDFFDPRKIRICDTMKK
ncbi:MAG: hypothetical protein AB1468_04795 [Candidatus Micrarchaeota archaeon]